MLNRICNLFFLWTLIGSVWAWIFPAHFVWFIERGYTAPGLGLIMLGMGMTLSIDDFRNTVKLSQSVLIGVSSQFLIMPGLGVACAFAFDLPKELKVGLILVSCCPGGTASNVIAYLAHANVALSVVMTMVSTFLAIVMTPILTQLLAGALIEVDSWGLFKSMLTIVMLPVIGGLALNHFLGKRLQMIKAVSPLVSILVIVLIVGAIIGKSKALIIESGWSLIAAVVTMHLLGFLLGYFLMKILKMPTSSCRTISIEVGMQNSGLGAALAKQHFSLVAATPCAISALCHCILGSVCAAIWRNTKCSEE